jgi:hypothetical protein
MIRTWPSDFPSMQKQISVTTTTTAIPRNTSLAVVMQVPVKESRIHTSSKFGDHKDAEAILCYRHWNCDRDDQRLPPPGAQVGAVRRMSPKHLRAGTPTKLWHDPLDARPICLM